MNLHLVTESLKGFKKKPLCTSAMHQHVYSIQHAQSAAFYHCDSTAYLCSLLCCQVVADRRLPTGALSYHDNHFQVLPF